jgi:hypothetical protein
MSKETINLSKVDYIANYLSNNKIPFKIILLEKIKGRGINDTVFPFKKFLKREYFLRRLEYANYIVLEQIVFIKDKELDDFIISKEYEKGKEPIKWTTKIYK